MKEMEEKLRGLIALQDCDIKIGDIIDKKEKGPLRVKDLEQQLVVVENRYREALNDLEVHKKERREMDREVENLKSRIGKSKKKLGEIKSNKEYKAALKEIDELEREQGLLEDRIIESMESQEELEQRCKDLEKEKKDFEESVEKEQKQVEKDLKALERDLEAIREKRSGIAQKMDKKMLEKYEFLRARRGGIAITSVIRGVCQTCRMGMPPQRFNELVRGEGLMDCPHCKRIIYWGESEGLKFDDDKSDQT